MTEKNEKMTSCNIEESVHRKLKQLALDLNMKMYEVLRMLVNSFKKPSK